MVLLVAAIVVAASVAWAGRAVVRELQATRAEARSGRVLRVLTLFAPGVAAAIESPRALLAWQPLAVAARKLLPDECAAIDRAAGATFPFGSEQIQAAHSRWTAEWLAWERSHDADFKLKVAAAEVALERSGQGALERAQLESVEREKLDSYQRRYEEYVRVGKALQALIPHDATTRTD